MQAQCAVGCASVAAAGAGAKSLWVHGRRRVRGRRGALGDLSGAPCGPAAMPPCPRAAATGAMTSVPAPAAEPTLHRAAAALPALWTGERHGCRRRCCAACALDGRTPRVWAPLPGTPSADALLSPGGLCAPVQYGLWSADIISAALCVRVRARTAISNLCSGLMSPD